MTPIDFGVIRSKVKVTVTLKVKMVSADLEKYLSQSLHILHVDWLWLVDDLYWFLGH